MAKEKRRGSEGMDPGLQVIVIQGLVLITLGAAVVVPAMMKEGHLSGVGISAQTQEPGVTQATGMADPFSGEAAPETREELVSAIGELFPAAPPGCILGIMKAEQSETGWSSLNWSATNNEAGGDGEVCPLQINLQGEMYKDRCPQEVWKGWETVNEARKACMEYIRSSWRKCLEVGAKISNGGRNLRPWKGAESIEACSR